MEIPSFLKKGQYYATSELTKEFGGSIQHGIIYSREKNVILAISGGVKYRDRPDENNPNIFLYHGSGENRDQSPDDAIVGNRQLRDSAKNNTRVFLFYKPNKGAKCKFIGEVCVVGEPYHDSPDPSGYKKIVFRFQYISDISDDDLMETIKGIPDNELINIVHSKPEVKSITKVSTSIQHNRNSYVRLYALRRSKGICDLCGNDAPFKKNDGTSYLEVHHIVPLSDGGPDLWCNVCSLCPNCHRKMHIVKDDNDIQKLKKIASIQLSTTNN